VNPATGLGTEPVTIKEINAVIERGSETVKRILSRAAKSLVSKLDSVGAEA
jgi:hypothetical protein